MIANESSQTFFSIMAKNTIPKTGKPTSKVALTAKLTVTPDNREMLTLMLKKANLTLSDILRTATARFVNNSIELLSESELKQYQDLLK